MNRPELYKKTVDILYQAYFNNTLEHGNCKACAVGNLVACNSGYRIARMLNGKLLWLDRTGRKVDSTWGDVFRTPPKRLFRSQKQIIDLENFFGSSESQILSTGYNVDELARIEFSFETASKGKSDEDYMYNGLAAVLEVLKQIHNITDEDNINNTRFTDHYKHRLAIAK
jgi:hypothetical protein